MKLELEELASKYSGFLSTLNAGKPSGKVNSAIVCSHCNKPGHNDKECYTKYPHLNPRRNPKGKGDKGKDGKGNPNCSTKELSSTLTKAFKLIGLVSTKEDVHVVVRRRASLSFSD